MHAYYARFARITSRHEHWSAPEYYQEAEEKLRKQIEAEKFRKELTARQEKLKVQLAKEAKQMDDEMRGNSSLYKLLKLHFDYFFSRQSKAKTPPTSSNNSA